MRAMGRIKLILLISAFLAYSAANLCAQEVPSLQALMDKQYDGRELTIKKVLFKEKNYTRNLITYKSGNLTISGIMNVPKGKGPFPVLILNHGFIDPKVYTVGRGLKREQDYFANRGYIVIHPDYRNHGLSDKDPEDIAGFRLGYVVDAINCIMAVKKSDKLYFNKEKIGLFGHSMGGGVVLNLLVVKPEMVRAAVLFAPTSADYRDNFTRWLWKRKHHPEIAEKIIATYGSPEANPSFWAGLSAINYFANIKVPILIQHGTSDESVPVEWSERLEKALVAAGKEVSLIKYPGEKHEFDAMWPTAMKRSVDFFNKYLKGK